MDIIILNIVHCTCTCTCVACTCVCTCDDVYECSSIGGCYHWCSSTGGCYHWCSSTGGCYHQCCSTGGCYHLQKSSIALWDVGSLYEASVYTVVHVHCAHAVYTLLMCDDYFYWPYYVLCSCLSLIQILCIDLAEDVNTTSVHSKEK